MSGKLLKNFGRGVGGQVIIQLDLCLRKSLLVSVKGVAEGGGLVGSSGSRSPSKASNDSLIQRV